MTNIEEIEELEEDTQKDKFLLFSIDTNYYGIDIKTVIEIIGIQPITEVPELPDYIRGVINLRGTIIPVMDVRLRFEKEYREYCDRTCIIVIETNNVMVGLIVDSVAEVAVIPNENIMEPPCITSEGYRYIKGIGKCGDSVRLIIDCDRLLNEEESRSISDFNV
ncbi:chemotaxis protein CheW [Anaeromicropila herbilytica]|uniref:Chemotaxis protein CheW n=1 Tax=Anaeromicropila herbilytica TaxID=2785025 RepID=A0A7R7ICB4_9FIRM|nr:chemotaxis protein CheW [Anaeromicropila herbilytica]BCN30558.1 chemotaxis protein CheW [Anaeromicropila herbilytica]